MNLLDIIALVALGYGAYKGFKNGVIIEVAGLVGIVIGFWAGMRLAFIFAHYYRDNFHLPSNLVPAIAFFTAFAIALGAVYLAGWAATKFLQTAQINLPNRLAGAAFGILKWGFLAGAFFSIIGHSQMVSPATAEGSATYGLLTSYSNGLQGYSIGLLPKARNVMDDMENYFVELDSVRQSHKTTPADSIVGPKPHS